MQSKKEKLRLKREYRKTKKGLVLEMYGAQKLSSKRRGHIPPTYTLKELREWCYSQESFHVMYDNWKRLDYQSGYAPSVDRIDDTIGYTMANIQIMTWAENNKKGNISRRKLDDKSVLEIRSSSKSARALGREYGVSDKTISGILKNKIYKDI